MLCKLLSQELLVLYKTANYYNFYNGLNYFVIHENCEKEYDLDITCNTVTGLGV